MPVAMLKLIAFSPYERSLAGLLKERLEMEGIACLLRNEELFAAMGEIPFWELRPELWIIDEDVLPRARLLLEGWLDTRRIGSALDLPGCGEHWKDSSVPAGSAAAGGIDPARAPAAGRGVSSWD